MTRASNFKLHFSLKRIISSLESRIYKKSMSKSALLCITSKSYALFTLRWSRNTFITSNITHSKVITAFGAVLRVSLMHTREERGGGEGEKHRTRFKSALFRDYLNYYWFPQFYYEQALQTIARNTSRALICARYTSSTASSDYWSLAIDEMTVANQTL